MDIEKYSKNYPIYYTGKIPQLLREYLRPEEKLSLIDCGCGDGGLLQALKINGFLKNKKVYAIDLSKNRLKLVKAIDKSIITYVDNAEELKHIKNSCIDFFISTQVIEHVGQDKMLKNIARVMRKNGTVYITTVYKKWYGWYFYRNHGAWVIDPTHLREYGKDSELLEDVKKYGLKVIVNQKKLIWFPVIGYFVKLFSIKNRMVYDNKLMRALRHISIPILGYYTWELMLEKNNIHD